MLIAGAFLSLAPPFDLLNANMSMCYLSILGKSQQMGSSRDVRIYTLCWISGSEMTRKERKGQKFVHTLSII